MGKARVHLVLPHNLWVRNGFTWCLNLLEDPNGQKTWLPIDATCPQCLNNFQKASEDSLHPLRAYRLLDTLQRSSVMNSPEIVARYCHSMIHEKQIILTCLALSSSQRLIHSKVLIIGTMTAIVTHPREIFEYVLSQNAFGFILVQNQPSGEVEPDEKACELTDQMIKCSKLMQIEFYDHMIVALEGYYSFREQTALWL